MWMVVVFRNVWWCGKPLVLTVCSTFVDLIYMDLHALNFGSVRWCHQILMIVFQFFMMIKLFLKLISELFVRHFFNWKFSWFILFVVIKHTFILFIEFLCTFNFQSWLMIIQMFQISIPNLVTNNQKGKDNI